MTIKFQITDKKNYVHVIAQGYGDKLKEAMEYVSSIRKFCADNKTTNKILCDERNLIYNLEIFDSYSLAEHASKTAPIRTRVAVVCSPNNKDIQFYENVAVNRSFQLRFFPKISEAKNWLLKD